MWDLPELPGPGYYRRAGLLFPPQPGTACGMGTLVLTEEGQAGHTLSVEAPQCRGRRMAEMTFYDPLTPEESAYHCQA